MYKERELSELKKNADNPRIISESEFKTLVESIKNNPDYFQARPIILSDRTGELVIIGGNQRYEAAKYIGLKKVPTYLLQGLTEEREREIAIRDNVNNGEWDMDVLFQNFDSKMIKDWGLNIPIADDFGTKLLLKSGDKENKAEITFTFSKKQMDFLQSIIEKYSDLPEANINNNKKGNIIHYIIEQWENVKKS